MADENRILAVDRGTQGREIHQTRDRLLLDSVCSRLERLGYDIERIGENQLPEVDPASSPGRIISMAQAPENTARLAELEAAGAVVVNSFSSILQTYRSFLTIAMARRPQLPFAPGAVLTSLDPEEIDSQVDILFDRFSGTLGTPFWLKRGDVHAAHERDVQSVSTPEEFTTAISDMRDRGVATAVVQKHIEGDVYKFYAVAGGRFFHLASFETGQPVIGGDRVLENLAMHTGDYLDLTVFGGDAVRTGSGWILIDVNAWPSFGTVREPGAQAIVEALLERFGSDGTPDDEDQRDDRQA